MPPHFVFEYHFHSAGQGIFASGMVTDSDGGRCFHWVFDCGSTSAKTVLKPQILQYRETTVGDRLDLLCISHFDNDHVSGLADLLDQLNVGTVVMPYLSPLERLVLGAVYVGDDEEYIGFLADPIAFLIEHAKSIERIIIVSSNPPDGEDQPLVPRPSDSPDPSGRDQREAWRLKPELERVFDPAPLIGEEAATKANIANTQVIVADESFAAQARSPSYRAAWEFKFFHKPIHKDFIKAIRKAVAKCFLSKVIPATGDRITSTLSSVILRRKIKAAYVAVLSKLPKEDINSTSLCVYSGPLPVENQVKFLFPPCTQTKFRILSWMPDWVWEKRDTPASILYTGDADLSLDTNRDDLRNFLEPGRWDQIAILQVPHHGSRENWEVGSSDEFPHRYSVFCADEHNLRYKHPHREVVVDLLHRGPLLANTETKWSWRGAVWVR